MANEQNINGIRGHMFTNWSQTFSCEPELYFCPESEDDVVKILNKAKENNKKVRVIGCGNSPSDISCTVEYMVDLKRMNKLIEANKEDNTVKVEAGMTILSLCEEYLPVHNLGLSTAGSFPHISIGGAISTGTHGSGINYGNLASYVTELDLILASGTKIRCSRKENEEMFLAACCGLGAIGIITTIKLKCEPAFKLEQNTYPAPLNDVLDNLEMHQKSSDHFRFLWYSHTDYVTVSHVRRTNLPNLKLPLVTKLTNYFWNYIVGFYLLEFCYWFSSFYPKLLVPLVNKLFFQLRYSRQEHVIDTSHKVFTFECLFKQFVTEWAIPKDKCVIVLKKLKEWFDTEPGAYAHSPVEVRFVKGDDLYISPASGETTCYINIVAYRPYGKSVPIKPYWKAFESIVKGEGGRPHWAKAHGETYEDFDRMYPKWRKWCEIRTKLDPDGIFLNPYLERILEGR